MAEGVAPTTVRSQPALTEKFEIGGVEIPNRVLLAPLASIGNWFVRLQAKRYGAGLTVSEMVSSFGLHYGNEKTMNELMKIHPDEHPVSIQLFGQSLEAMESGARIAAGAGADLIDINMGCPVPKVRKTGAGAELLSDPELALDLARAARQGSGLPVTVKIRSGLMPGDRSGYDLAIRLVEEAGVAGIGFHPRVAKQGHKGQPDYAMARELSEAIDVPMIISGGLSDAEAALTAYEQSNADAVMIARGSLGYPWVFAELTGREVEPPNPETVMGELLWVMDRAEEHFGEDRAGRYLRKFYPWYLDQLDVPKVVRSELCQTAGLDRAREIVSGIGRGEPVIV
ncbi:MAG TPA: tRNA-dihydrouridine synthase [Solirubrobacterales bacterium]|nr:tRNA-dihydrouridine synthase [Solirubrobacterales bacterium]